LNEPVLSATKKTRKRTFLGLLLLAVLLLLIGSGVYLVFFTRDPYIAFSRGVVTVLVTAVLVLTALFLCGLLAIVITIMHERTFRGLGWLMEKTILLFYPVVLQVGRFLQITQDKIQRSFIEVNNQLVRSRPLKVSSRELLLLLPHCLQDSGCPYNITRNIDNCRRCGGCQVSEIVSMSGSRGVKAEMVTGGTMARQAIEEHAPQAVVALACERDLSSGVLDSFPLPVMGVVNDRPQGPCLNTRVDLGALEEAFDHFLNKQRPA